MMTDGDVKTVSAKAITKDEWYEFVTVSGYLEITASAAYGFEGHEAVVVSGQLMRAVHHAKDGWTELLIGPQEKPISVWVPKGGTIEVTER